MRGQDSKSKNNFKAECLRKIKLNLGICSLNNQILSNNFNAINYFFDNDVQISDDQKRLIENCFNTIFCCQNIILSCQVFGIAENMKGYRKNSEKGKKDSEIWEITEKEDTRNLEKLSDAACSIFEKTNFKDEKIHDDEIVEIISSGSVIKRDNHEQKKRHLDRENFSSDLYVRRIKKGKQRVD